MNAIPSCPEGIAGTTPPLAEIRTRIRASEFRGGG
jgi:hypothetical protein